LSNNDQKPATSPATSAENADSRTDVELRAALQHARGEVSQLEYQLQKAHRELAAMAFSRLSPMQRVKRRILTMRGGWRLQAAWWRLQKLIRLVKQRQEARHAAISKTTAVAQRQPVGEADEAYPAYKAHTRAQAEYFQNYIQHYSRQNRREILSLLARHPNRKGIVLCPVAYDLDLKQRPDHIMAEFEKDGYLCIQLEFNVGPPVLRRRSEGHYVSNMAGDFFALLHKKSFVLYLHWPGFLHFSQLCPNALVIYDVLDDLTVFANPSDTMRLDHEVLLDKADISLFSAKKLLDNNKDHTSNGILYENGVYASHFSHGVRELCKLPGDSLIDLTKTVVGYHGVISELIDFDLIDAIAALPEVVLLFVGPVAAFEPENLDEVKRRMTRLARDAGSRFIHLGPKNYSELKHYLAWIDVGIVPFHVNVKTDSVSPLKLFEYLAAGKPVIGTPTRTMRNYEDAIMVASGKQFVDAIATGAWRQSFTPASAQLAASHEWSELHRPLREFVASRASAQVASPGRDRPKVDIVNVNFYDWNGEVVFKGGAERYVYDLAVLLKELGCEVRILQNSHKPFERMFKGIPVLGIGATSQLDLEYLSIAYASYCRDSDALIASPAELACRLPNSKKVLSINHGIHWDGKNNRVDHYDRSRYNLILDAVKNSDSCVCVDTNFINWMRTYDWQLANSLSYVPNYVDLKQFKPYKKDFNAEPLCFLYPRRLYEPRGLYLTIDAFDALFDRHDNIRLIFCGQAVGDDVTATNNFIARHPGRVTWIEHDMEDMHLAYEDSHVVLVPTSESEGTSLSCIEALATNNAVISTNVGGLPNLIVNGYNGLLIRPNVWDLVQAAETLISDRLLAGKLATNGLNTAEAFSKDAWERRWAEVIKSVILSD
jgi:glycosyltransferase involved in cell wall biosynthesis